MENKKNLKRLFKPIERKCIFSPEDISIIKKSYKLYKKNKVNKMYNKIKDVEDLDDKIKQFVFSMEKKDEGLFGFELDCIEKIIKILKMAYENAYANIISDELFDNMVLRFKVFRQEPVEAQIVSRAEAVTTHAYENLKGSLGKRHYIVAEKESMYIDSIEKFIDEVLDIYFIDRDYYHININEPIRILLSFKYDGVSCVIELDHDGRIIDMVTRGKNGKGVSLLSKFPHLDYMDCEYFRHHDNRLGLQTELMMTNKNIKKYSQEKGYNYVNSRTSVTSILTALDGYKYSHFITPVPLAYEDETGRLDPKLLNNFEKGLPFYSHIVTVHTDDKSYEEVKKQLMEQIKTYILDTLSLRQQLPFQIDGVVIEVLNEDIAISLGRKGEINNYQVAYKFPSLASETIVRGAKFNVGRTGLVSPVIYYDPVVFNGTSQTKTTLSSRNRYEKLDPHVGDTGLVEYSNDCIPYFNRIVSYNGGPKLFFPKTCPICGYELDEEGANSYCRNPECPPKQIKRFTNFIKVLGVRDASEKLIEKCLDENLFAKLSDVFTSFEGDNKVATISIMMEIDGVGTKKIAALISELDKIKESHVSEATLLESVGVSGKATCEGVLKFISLEKLLEDPDILYNMSIDNMQKKAKTNFIKRLKEANITGDIYRLIEILKPSKVKYDYDMSVCFTGFRDENFKKELNERNIEVRDSLKNIDFVIIPSQGTSTGKTENALKRGIKVITIQHFKEIIGMEE